MYVDSKGLMTYTISHELTHFIQEWSPAKYNAFKKFLVKNYVKGLYVVDGEAYTLDKLVAKHISEAKAAGRNMTYSQALDEVVAEACEKFLVDSDAFEKIAQLKKEDAGLWAKI